VFGFYVCVIVSLGLLICDRNSEKSWWIFIIFTYLETGMNAVCKYAIYLLRGLWITVYNQPTLGSTEPRGRMTTVRSGDVSLIQQPSIMGHATEEEGMWNLNLINHSVIVRISSQCRCSFYPVVDVLQELCSKQRWSVLKSLITRRMCHWKFSCRINTAAGLR